MTSETMQAIKIVSVGKAEIQTVPLPKLLDHYVLVKVNAVAINPTDWYWSQQYCKYALRSSRLSRKHIDYEVLTTPGTTVGCDFTGTVVALGSKVTKDYKPGDRIAGVTHGSNASRFDSGCFADYCIVKEGATFKVPDDMSDEKAATVGVAVTTVSLALYDNLGMPYPGSDSSGNGEWVLIYGGSTATGILAIQSAVQWVFPQLLRKGSLEVQLTILQGLDTKSWRLAALVTMMWAFFYADVSSTSANTLTQYVKSLGAEAAFDYNDPDCSKKINEHTSDSVKLALDCIAEGDSTKITTAAISSSGGKIASLLPLKDQALRSDIEYSVSRACIL
jgi:NADPH:quinone reductase-like Zn-dependent oxidoreductase